MVLEGRVIKNKYFDSVTLMILAKKIKTKSGVIDAAVVMGTKENQEILKNSQMFLDVFSGADTSDMLVAISAKTSQLVEEVIKDLDQTILSLKKNVEGKKESIKSIEAATQNFDANMALISVPGKYAALVADDALNKNLNVMMFSDNVSIEDEILLKKKAHAKKLLMMGPDCGTAIINGVPLAFANVVKKGSIGVVAASGTGLQEVTVQINNLGGGISQAIGTGGRDIKKEIGGVMMIDAIKMLDKDKETKVIVLVSKPPHLDVLKKIGNAVKKIKKPVIAVFLGAEKNKLKEFPFIFADTLFDAAMLAVKKSGLKKLPKIDAVKIKSKNIKQRTFLRGLYSGGTFAYEAQIILKDLENLYSNVATKNSLSLEDNSKSKGHTIIDLGEDEFTVGRPHPMIDFSLRNERILKEAEDKTVKVILFDLVLGYGSNLSPMKDLKETLSLAMKKCRQEIVFICNICGTNQDPQNKSQVVEELHQLGVHVLDNHKEAVILARSILK